MSKNPWTEWRIPAPLDFEVGQTYIVRSYHESGLWADFLLTITGQTPDGDFGFRVETMLDGSPGLMEGWDEGRASA